jgi:hypothetical protein
MCAYCADLSAHLRCSAQLSLSSASAPTRRKERPRDRSGRVRGAVGPQREHSNPFRPVCCRSVDARRSSPLGWLAQKEKNKGKGWAEPISVCRLATSTTPIAMHPLPLPLSAAVIDHAVCFLLLSLCVCVRGVLWVRVVLAWCSAAVLLCSALLCGRPVIRPPSQQQQQQTYRHRRAQRERRQKEDRRQTDREVHQRGLRLSVCLSGSLCFVSPSVRKHRRHAPAFLPACLTYTPHTTHTNMRSA